MLSSAAYDLVLVVRFQSLIVRGIWEYLPETKPVGIQYTSRAFEAPPSRLS